MWPLLGALAVFAAEAGAEDCGGSGTEGILVTEESGSYTCQPSTGGPFPGVLYSHGGKNGLIGGDLQGTCEALARAGYLAYAKFRLDPPGKTIPLHALEVEQALTHLLGLLDVDTTRIGVIGYSRGGTLTYALAESQNEVIDATILLAPAAAGSYLQNQTADVSPIDAPVFVGVAENDLYQDDHVTLANDLVAALTDGEKHVFYYPYPHYPDLSCPGCDGHQVFQVVDDEYTDYWCDVEDFLSLHVAGETIDLPGLGAPGAAIAVLALLLGAGWMHQSRKQSSLSNTE